MDRRVLAVVVVGCLLAGLAHADRPTKRPTDQERGKQLYERHCLPCHGATALGDGPVAKSLTKPIPSLADTITEDNLDDEVQVLLTGKGLMPSYEASFDKYDARRVLRYAKHLAETPPGQAPGPAPDQPPAEDDNQE